MVISIYKITEVPSLCLREDGEAFNRVDVTLLGVKVFQLFDGQVWQL